MQFIFYILALLFLTQCKVLPDTGSPSEETPASETVTQDDSPQSVPDNYVLLMDGSGFTPVSGTRTYDYGKWTLLQSTSDWTNAASVLWYWSPLEETGFTQVQKDAFIGARDGKFVKNRTQILVVGSNGGVALIQYSPKKVLFYANVGASTNPHSAELLPDGTIAVASSADEKLTLISTASMDDRSISSTYTQSYALAGAHGVVWDSERELLWALGTTLKAYSYNEDRLTPALNLENSTNLPSDTSGHDLNLNLLGKFFVTSNNWSGTYDADSDVFDTVPFFTQIKVKSMTEGNFYDADVGGLIPGILYTYPVPDSRIGTPTNSWWTPSVSFLTSAGKLITKELPGARIYKARF